MLNIFNIINFYVALSYVFTSEIIKFQLNEIGILKHDMQQLATWNDAIFYYTSKYMYIYIHIYIYIIYPYIIYKYSNLNIFKQIWFL